MARGLRKISAGLLAIAGITAISDIFAFALSSSLLAENSFMAIIIVIGVTILIIFGKYRPAICGLSLPVLARSPRSASALVDSVNLHPAPTRSRLSISASSNRWPCGWCCQKQKGGFLPTQKTLTTGLIARAPRSNLAGWGQAQSILMIRSPSNPSAKVQGAIFHAAI